MIKSKKNKYRSNDQSFQILHNEICYLDIKYLKTIAYNPNLNKILFVDGSANFNEFIRKYGYLREKRGKINNYSDDNILGIKWIHLSKNFTGICIKFDLVENQFSVIIHNNEKYISRLDIEHCKDRFIILNQANKKKTNVNKMRRFEVIEPCVKLVNAVYINNTPMRAAFFVCRDIRKILERTNRYSPSKIKIYLREKVEGDLYAYGNVYAYVCERKKLLSPLEFVAKNDTTGANITYTYTYQCHIKKIPIPDGIL